VSGRLGVKLRSLTPKRPLTYDLMTQLVERLGGRIEAVQLSALRDETFFATLRIVANGTTTELDCRPSDALALAIRMGTPIFIADDVLAQAGEDKPMTISKPEDNNQGKAIMPLELERFRQVTSNFFQA
jgi:bifunctional DNase/RNase